MLELIFPYLLLLLGILLIFLSYPKYRERWIKPLQDQEILPTIKFDEKKHEVIAGGKQNFSIFFTGIIVIILALALIIL